MNTLARIAPAAAALVALALAGSAGAQALAAAPAAQSPGASIAPELAQQLQRLAGASASAAMGATPVRVEVELGQLDPRLHLAPCELIQPYLPTGVRPLGRSRIGLRCLQGPVRWNVYLPVTVKVFAPALVGAAALPAGTVLRPEHLALAEVDLAASPDPTLSAAALAVGRTLVRPLAAGQPLHRGDLRPRQYFDAGDVVRVTALGPGYSVSVEGLAVSAGVEGRSARVRVESGRILSGLPAGERRVEVRL